MNQNSILTRNLSEYIGCIGAALPRTLCWSIIYVVLVHSYIRTALVCKHLNLGWCCGPSKHVSSVLCPSQAMDQCGISARMCSAACNTSYNRTPRHQDGFQNKNRKTSPSSPRLKGTTPEQGPANFFNKGLHN